jgi:hypothetical protein
MMNECSIALQHPTHIDMENNIKYPKTATDPTVVGITECMKYISTMVTYENDD